MATIAEQLAEAKAALHRLMTGEMDVEIHSASGEVVKYAPVDMAGLQSYIAQLETQLPPTNGGGARRARSIKVFY